MSAAATIIDRDFGWANTKLTLLDLGAEEPLEVAVGIRGHKGQVVPGRKKASIRVGAPARTRRGSEPEMTLVQIAMVNEFGARWRFGHGGRIPERSFLRSSFDENLAKYAERAIVGMRQAVQGKIKLPIMLGRLGALMVADVQRKIRKGPFVKNAPMTIALKGSTKPLIDSGRLRASIEAKVRPYGSGAGGGE